MGTGPFHKIIVGYDASATGWDALQLGAVLGRATGARLVVGAIADPRLGPGEAVEDRLREARGLLPEGTPADFRSASAPAADAGLRELALGEGADLIVVGWTHRSAFARATVGGTGEHLLHGAPCAVAVAPSGYAQQAETPLGVIAVGYDGSHEAHAALDLAIALARACGATVRIIGVLEPVPVVTGGFAAAYSNSELEQESRERLRENLEGVAASVPGDLHPEVVVGSGSAPEELIGKLGPAGLLVVGSRGHGSFRRVLFGSVAASLAHTSPCPLIITPRGA